jgi:DNA (cytosine-5)-methyltransferase 1
LRKFSAKSYQGTADAAPEKNFVGIPRLTNRMVARIQGFPDSWEFSGGKTATYRQIGNAFPSPVPAAVARQIAQALQKSNRLVSVTKSA